MNNSRIKIRNLAITLLILIITAAMMVWQYDYWSGAQKWTAPSGSVFIYTFLNALPIDYVGRVDSTTTLYVVSSSAPLALYFTTVMLSRQYKHTLPVISAGAVISVLGVLTSLFGSAVILKNVSYGTDRGEICLVFNCIIITVMVLAIEIPSFVKNRKQLMKKNSVVSALCRYGLMLALALVVLLLSSCLLGILQKFNSSAVNYVAVSFSVIEFTDLITGCIVDQLFEETFFRGCIFGNLKKYVPVWMAALLSSMCFGLWHRNIGQFVYTFACGFVWCYIYHFTGRLRYTMISHSVVNLVSFLALRSRFSTTSFLPYCKPLFELNNSIRYSSLFVCIVLALACCAAIIGGILMLKRYRPSVKQEP